MIIPLQKGPTLEEIARLFDGKDANVAGKDLIEHKVHVEEIEDAEATHPELYRLKVV
jgi:hypothetical protein